MPLAGSTAAWLVLLVLLVAATGICIHCNIMPCLLGGASGFATDILVPAACILVGYGDLLLLWFVFAASAGCRLFPLHGFDGGMVTITRSHSH
jgi:hypothetical protein